jgi:hypothetical protein
MAHGGDEAAAQALNRAELERSLLSNSTKRRISSLHTLQQRIEEDGKEFYSRAYRYRDKKLID